MTLGRWLRPAGCCLALATVLAGPVLSCDPDHAWKPFRRTSRQVVSSRAIQKLAWATSSRITGRVAGDHKLVLLVSAQDSQKAETGSDDEGWSAEFMQGLAAHSGCGLVPAGQVSKLLAHRTSPETAVHDPRFFQELSRVAGATLFLKIRLASSRSHLRQMEDLNPRNPGLLATQVVDRIGARISIQKEDGTYLLIDEIEVSAMESYLYFAADGVPVRLVEAYVERPGQSPSFWSAGKSHDHFSF